MSTKIERRHVSVPLYVGNYQNELNTLLEEAMAAQRDEESGVSPQRQGTRSKAIALARKYDALLAEANEAAINVEIHEISNTEWQQLADEHPPREGDAADKKLGMNAKTFPRALLVASLGKPAPIDLDEISPVHYTKLERAAWKLHNGDDALPLFSLVSLLKQARDPDSKQPNDSE